MALPLPPDPPLATVSQGDVGLTELVQLVTLAAVTVAVPVCAADDNDAGEGDSATMATVGVGAVPACVTDNVTDVAPVALTVIVALREFVPVFAVAVYVTSVVPLPPDDGLIVSQDGSLLVADQPVVLAAVTVAVPVWAAVVRDAGLGLVAAIASVGVAAVPACDTNRLTVVAPVAVTVIVALREAVPPLAVAE